MASLYFTMPGNNDILGDRWASRVRSLFDAACKRLDVPQVGKGMGAVWNLFQWQYCKGADMMCRVVASPQAMVACGWDITPDIIGSFTSSRPSASFPKKTFLCIIKKYAKVRMLANTAMPAYA